MARKNGGMKPKRGNLLSTKGGRKVDKGKNYNTTHIRKKLRDKGRGYYEGGKTKKA